MSVIPETSQPAMGPYFSSASAGFLSKALTAFFRDFLLVKVPAALVGPGGGGGWAGGEGGAAGGGGAGGGEGQLFFTHWLNFFVHFLHFFSLPASTPVASRSEMRSRIMSFIVWALCVPARAKAMAHDRTRARRR